MPNPPFVPKLVDTGNFEKDVKENILMIYWHLLDLSSYLAEGEPDSGWSVTGVTSDKVLAVGDTLTQTQNVLGTLLQKLAEKGVLSA